MMDMWKAAIRQLQRSFGFSATVILILGIGIGVTTAMYSILYAVVLQPLPFPKPDRLVFLSAKPWDNFSYPTLKDWERRTRAFQSLAASSGWSPRIESSAGVGHADAILVSQNYLSTLGANLAFGRDFTQTSNEANCLNQVIVTQAYWQRMGGGQSLSGETLQLDRKTYAVIGVLAPVETGGNLDGSVVLTTLGCDSAKAVGDRGDSAFQGVGRLRPGVSLAEAALELSTAQGLMRRDYPNLYTIYLLKEQQGCGLGRRLLSALTADLLAKKYSSMLVWVLEQNAAVHFYEHAGAQLLTSKKIEIGGAELPELALGWPDLHSVLQ